MYEYTSGQPIKIKFDDGNETPAVLSILPMNGKAHAKWRALREWKRTQEKDLPPPKSADEAMERAASDNAEHVDFSASRVTEVAVGYPDGPILTTYEEIRDYVDGQMPIQQSLLFNAMMDARALRDLRFCPDDLPGAEGGAGEPAQDAPEGVAGGDAT